MSRAAWTSLNRISTFSGYSSVSDLIAKNTDYVIDTICHHFSHLQEFPQAPQVLKGILQFTDTSILPLLEDTLDSVFHSLDVHSSAPVALTFLKILHNIILVFHKNIPNHISHQKETKNSEEEGGGEEEVSEKSSRPASHSFTLEILEKDQHFLGSKSREIKLLALDIIEKGVAVLGTSEGSGLLPMIHTLWSPLMRRFVDKDTVVVIKSIAVAEVMIECSKDFMTVRFANELWPLLKNTLTPSSSSLRSKEEPKFSQAFKLRRVMLSCLHTAAKHLHLRETTVVDIATTCKYYLSSTQPPELQADTVQLFRELLKLDEAAIRSLLCQLKGIPLDTQQDHHSPVITSSNSEFEVNSSLLLNIQNAPSTT